jgi:hypothetical protein
VLYGMGSLHPPGDFVTAAVLSDTTKGHYLFTEAIYLRLYTTGGHNAACGSC